MSEGRTWDLLSVEEIADDIRTMRERAPHGGGPVVAGTMPEAVKAKVRAACALLGLASPYMGRETPGAWIDSDAEPDPGDGRPFAELSTSGMLWLINRVCFHPRGFALAINYDDAGAVTGWSLLGNGASPWSFADDIDDEYFARSEATLAALRSGAHAPRAVCGIPASGMADEAAFCVREPDHDGACRAFFSTRPVSDAG